jgi:hypothetical protein
MPPTLSERGRIYSTESGTEKCERYYGWKKAYGGVDVPTHIFLTSALVGGE